MMGMCGFDCEYLFWICDWENKKKKVVWFWLFIVYYYFYGVNGIFKIWEFFVFGYEFCGVIIVVGFNVNFGFNFKVGDRVVMEVGVYCKICKMCWWGRYNFCVNMWFVSFVKIYFYLDGILWEVMMWFVELVYKWVYLVLKGMFVIFWKFF